MFLAPLPGHHFRVPFPPSAEHVSSKKLCGRSSLPRLPALAQVHLTTNCHVRRLQRSVSPCRDSSAFVRSPGHLSGPASTSPATPPSTCSHLIFILFILLLPTLGPTRPHAYRSHLCQILFSKENRDLQLNRGFSGEQNCICLEMLPRGVVTKASRPDSIAIIECLRNQPGARPVSGCGRGWGVHQRGDPWPSGPPLTQGGCLLHSRLPARTHTGRMPTSVCAGRGDPAGVTEVQRCGTSKTGQDPAGQRGDREGMGDW